MFYYLFCKLLNINGILRFCNSTYLLHNFYYSSIQPLQIIYPTSTNLLSHLSIFLPVPFSTFTYYRLLATWHLTLQFSRELKSL